MGPEVFFQISGSDLNGIGAYDLASRAVPMRHACGALAHACSYCELCLCVRVCVCVCVWGVLRLQELVTRDGVRASGPFDVGVQNMVATPILL